MALFCCSQVSLVGGLVLRMSVLAGNKARTGMVGLRTTRIRGQRVTRGRGPENRAPRARIARLTQIGGPCGIPVHPGDIPTPKGVDRHPRPSREDVDQGPGPSGHRGPWRGRGAGAPRATCTRPRAAPAGYHIAFECRPHNKPGRGASSRQADGSAALGPVTKTPMETSIPERAFALAT